MRSWPILLSGVLALATPGCSDTPAGGGTDSGTPAADVPSTGDTSGGGADSGAPNCLTQDTADPVCPMRRFMNTMNTPGYRLTYIQISQPAALASATLLNVVNPTIQQGAFLWGLSLDLTAMTFRTGALRVATRGTVGQGLLDGTFRFFNNDATGMGMPNRYNPITGPVTVANNRATTTMMPLNVLLPILNPDGSVLTQLPLSAARMSNVQLTADRGCIGLGRPQGGRFNECRSPWTTDDGATPPVPYGQVDADITVADARNVPVSALNTTLCALIANTAFCASMGTPADIMMLDAARRPDSMVGTQPAWHLRAAFAAVSANIAP